MNPATSSVKSRRRALQGVLRERCSKSRQRTPLTNHWIIRLLKRRPNDTQNAFEFREMFIAHRALSGNAFCEIVANRDGSIAALNPINPDAMRIDLLDRASWRYRIKNRDGTYRILGRSEVWHVRCLSSNGPDARLCDGPNGLSGIQHGWLTRNELREAENFEPNDGLDEPLRPVNTQTEDEAVTRRMNSSSDAKAPETNGLRLIAGGRR
jgi:phage portal protein BeeE